MINLSKRFSAPVTRKHIGWFQTEIEAAYAYDMYVIHNNLTYRPLNFPEKQEDYLKRDFIIEKKRNKYIGVSKSYNKYLACIVIHGKKINLLLTNDEIEAAEAYDEFIVKNNIPKKKLNFPDKYPDYDPKSKLDEPKVIKNKCEIVDELTVKIFLNQDKDCLIDKEDYDRIKYYRCGITLIVYVSL